MLKTAYEMRISDWSSDVCSSDLLGGEVVALKTLHLRHRHRAAQIRILTRPFDHPAPARIARDVEHRAERPVDPVRSRLDRRRAVDALDQRGIPRRRSGEHTSELQTLMRTSYAVSCLKKK